MIGSTPLRLSVLGIIFVLLGSSSIVQAQSGKADKTRKKADYYYQEDNFVEAENLYKEVLNQNPSDYQAAYLLGSINSYLQDYRESLRYFRKAAEIDPARNDTVYLQIGLVYKRLNDYRKARESLEEFMRRHRTRDELYALAELEIKGCEIAEASLANERKEYRVNPTTFNSSAGDMFPAYLDQRQEDKFIVFTSHRAVGKKKKKKRIDPNTGEPNNSDLYAVVMENDSTFGAESIALEKIVNDKKRNNGSASFTADGLTMYFTICNTKANKNGCSIFTSRYNPIKKQWGKPQLVEGIAGKQEKIINSRGKTKLLPTNDRQPMVSRDGRTIFFVSDRDGGEGGFDIWFSRRLGTGWSDPVNAGANINTAFNEYTPFLNDAGSILYFGSNGRGGFGGIDLYKAEGAIGDWKEAENMKSPLNSSYDDYGAIFLDNDSTVIFTSDRPGGAGGDDIYWARYVPLDRTRLNVSVHGVVRDKVTQLPIPYATVELFKINEDQTITKIQDFSTGQDASYEFPLKVDTYYKVLGNAKEYLANEEEFNTMDVMEDTDLEKNIDIELDPIDITTTFTLQNVYYDFDEYYLRADALEELQNLLKIMRQNPNITILLEAHTDSNGSEPYNVELSNNRARAVIKYLAQNGIDPGRVAWLGYGESRLLIYPEMTDEDEQANRRTEFRITSINFGDDS
ncbi:MAG: OmpA family protein [Bacteroidota bacterium]